MEEEFEDDIPCSAIAVDSITRLATAGTIWGLCIGPYDGRKRGLAGVARASFVVKSAGRYGLQSGLFAGVFSTTRCGIQQYRKRKDWVNASIAGAIAGAAFAARTRSWIQVFGMAALVSTICSAADYSKTS
ncbi:outer envelope pore protein 16-4, chloroplastic isoform X2 [Telopea speciosissima]|uniref:outer envelope pore protein 16-4, chloroplastic isoform X2 n=1 Tax=Telopea speciosissima TaxID=54955 RepID=UPI001CC362AE|nr:outer envelope pore protein 16-4, chloroplastic isoform X2 [Telopea speciosissima]XP_043711065.1 outer envelope pore protein 16-4, chloroplastic isoform X2 [Telopea speciosissima]